MAKKGMKRPSQEENNKGQTKKKKKTLHLLYQK